MTDVHQLATGRDEKMFLLAMVDWLRRLLHVQPIGNKSTSQTRTALEKRQGSTNPKNGLTEEKDSMGNMKNFAWRKAFRCSVLRVSRSRVLRSAIFEPSRIQFCSKTCMKIIRVSTYLFTQSRGRPSTLSTTRNRHSSRSRAFFVRVWRSRPVMLDVFPVA